MIEESEVKNLDFNDPLKQYRELFHIPILENKQEKYFCGNSLGLMPKITSEYINLELEQWAKVGVKGHFTGDYP